MLGLSHKRVFIVWSNKEDIFSYWEQNFAVHVQIVEFDLWKMLHLFSRHGILSPYRLNTGEQCWTLSGFFNGVCYILFELSRVFYSKLEITFVIIQNYSKSEIKRLQIFVLFAIF